jgi:hypothetical protein
MILLQNYHDGRRLLEYAPETGEGVEIARDTASPPAARGFYVSVGHDLVGVYASPAGPVFFVNRDRYSMNDSSFGVELHRGEQAHHFVARCGGKLIYEVRYPRHTNWGHDSWSTDEESADWFMWLTSSSDGPQFYRFLTAPSDATPAARPSD